MVGRCLKCKTDNPQGAKFCCICGEIIQEEEIMKIVQVSDEMVGKTCPYCQAPFKNAEEVVCCPQCRMPHHKNCWNDNGHKCTIFGCMGREIKRSDMLPKGETIANNSFFGRIAVMLIVAVIIIGGGIYLYKTSKTPIIEQTKAKPAESEMKNDNTTANSSIVVRRTIQRQDLEMKSRYKFTMKDINGMQYFIYIYSHDEIRVTPGTVWSGANDVVFSGNYHMAIAKANSTDAIGQEVVLFESIAGPQTKGVFNVSETGFHNRAAVLRAEFQGQPDILFTAQQKTGSGDSGLRAFYIKNGEMQLIKWQSAYDGKIHNGVGSSGARIPSNIGKMRFRVNDWKRGGEYSGGVDYIYILNSSDNTMMLEEKILLNLTVEQRKKQVN